MPRGAQNVEGISNFGAREAVLDTLLLEAIESAGMAICVYDEERRYVTVNERACAILGCTSTERAYDWYAARTGRPFLVPSSSRLARVASLPYFVAVWWTLDADDQRAATAV